MSAELRIVLKPDGAGLGVEVTAPDPLPLERMLVGRPAVEVAELLPRLFNLCGAAQGQAARLALGLSQGGVAARHEILRDHLAKICLIWPKLLGLPPRPLPAAWAEGGTALQDWIWGGAMPERLAAFLVTGAGVAPLLSELARHFSPGEAVAELPALADPMVLSAQENSPAGRVADAALMGQAELLWGRGPLWRALGRIIDLHRLAATPYPAELRPDGTAVVAAARGAYAFAARAEEGRVRAFTRVTPTDHLLAQGGALERSLLTLPAAKADLATLVVDILDPCVPVTLEIARHA